MTLQRLEETLFHAWQEYEADVVPADASPVQREECRRSFYAGAVAAYALTLAACTPDDEAECEARLRVLSDEINSIIQDLKLSN